MHVRQHPFMKHTNDRYVVTLAFVIDDVAFNRVTQYVRRYLIHAFANIGIVGKHLAPFFDAVDVNANL
jgi:hypothetical protein